MSIWIVSFTLIFVVPVPNSEFNFNSFLNLNDEKEVAKAFAKCYERCGSSSLNQRQKNATTAYNYFTN